MQYFNLTPEYFNEYYAYSKIKIENKKIMQNALENSKYYIRVYVVPAPTAHLQLAEHWF